MEGKLSENIFSPFFSLSLDSGLSPSEYSNCTISLLFLFLLLLPLYEQRFAVLARAEMISRKMDYLYGRRSEKLDIPISITGLRPGNNRYRSQNSSDEEIYETLRNEIRLCYLSIQTRCACLQKKRTKVL